MKPTYEQLEQQLAEYQGKLEKMAAENAGLKAAIPPLKIINDVTDSWDDVSLAEEVGFNYAVSAILKSIPETPATDAFLAEVRASAIPESYVIVPQQIFLDPSDIESICSQCGDGHKSGYGDFTDGMLWVGNIQHDDGSIVHGLHISSADYTEEGGVTVCEFAAQLRQGVAS